MEKSFYGLSLIATVILAYDVVPHDSAYYTQKVRNTELIYTQQNMSFAQHAATVERQLQPLYEASFGYRMDETLFVGLISQNNQIANGFSTPFPNNRQINYIGGALNLDYFCATSWLDTLLYHETAHNYQGNVKDNIVSSSLHTVFGNGGLFVPLFTIPNIVESSFLLEGNAVLNESWHGNGGRLYSGRFKIATLMQAKADLLKPELVYNSNYNFLYGSHFYTLGGFYQKYLGENYGLKATNAYWKEHSQDWFWPFFTNNSMQRAVGIDFETSLETWADETKKEAQKVVVTKGEVLVKSQFFSPLNGDASQIYFMINESGRETPKLVRLDKKSDKIMMEKASYLSGRVVRTGIDTYRTQGSRHTSPWRIHIGLFDEDALVLEETESKVVQGYLSDGAMVYFDVPSSYDQPQLYVGDTFYGQVNSSVVIDTNDNLYYFKQEGKTRTLFKNTTPLFSYEGYYGVVSDIDSHGKVLFVANTQHGSGLFCVEGQKVMKMSQADTIIDARLISDTTALVVSMGSNAFLYEKIALEASEGEPYEVTLFVEDTPYYHTKVDKKVKQEVPTLDLEDNYYSLLDMHYSGTNIALGNSEDAGLVYNVAINFADPLTQNSFSAFVQRNLDQLTLAGASYSNNQYFLQYSLSAYSVVANDTDLETRDYGVSATAVLPLIKMGYYSSDINLGYYQDYTTLSREPYSLSVNLARFEQFGVSAKPNFLADVSLYGTYDRGDKTYGGRLMFEHDLPFESYISVGGQYSSSDAFDTISGANLEDRGVKLSAFRASVDNDPALVYMPSLRESIYLESIGKIGGELSIVSNASFYFFTFPISLRREIWSVGYHYYDLKVNRYEEAANEASASLVLDSFWFNKLPIPLDFSYYYNDNIDVADAHTFRFSLGLSF